MTYPTTNDEAANLGEFLQAVTDVSESLTSGTAIQNPTSSWAFLCCDIALGSAGTVKADIGPTSACADNVIPATAANAAASQKLFVPVPPGWFVKITVAVATISAANLITM